MTPCHDTKDMEMGRALIRYSLSVHLLVFWPVRLVELSISHTNLSSGYFPVDETHGCWTKSKQNPVFAVSVSVVVSTLFVCTKMLNGFI